MLSTGGWVSFIDIMQRDAEHVIQSCRNLVKTEIKTLRHDLGNLRGFLRNCQDTINSETTRLEKKCLGKIESLEEERINLGKVIENLREENESLRKSASTLSAKLKDTEQDLEHANENSSQLEVRIKSMESQLATKATQCKDFCKKLESSKLQCLSLENKLASNEAYVKEQKAILSEMSKDNKHLESNARDLQMRAAESEEYEKALESHIEELEAICSILREQHDEQRKYFLQKESSLKREALDVQRNLQGENKRLAHKIELLTTNLENETKKYIELQEKLNKLENQMQKKEKAIMELDEKLESQRHELQIEKATVEMLTRRNDDLTEEVAKSNNNYSILEEKMNSTEKLVNRKALKEIGNTVKQYIDESSSLSQKLESSLIASNGEKLEECERQLVYERQKRLNAEMEAANLSVELEKAKVEIAVYRSTRRSRQNSKSNLLALPGLVKSSPNVTVSSNALPITSLNAASPASVHSNDSTSSKHEVIPLLTPRTECVNGNDICELSRSVTPDINSAVSVAEISISERASRKMEEATRKAMEMLSNTPPVS